VRQYLRILRFRDFRYLFLGQSASVLGDRVVVVALALYVTRRTGSAADLGAVLAAQSLPLVALLLFGGVLADRLARQRIMLAADFVRGALHALVAALILAGSLQIWELVVIEACFGAAQAFFQPAYTGLIPQTVPEALIQDAQALTASTQNLAFLLGPALATVLVLGLGAGVAFALDAGSFAVSAALLLRVRARERGAPASDRAPGGLPSERAQSLLASLRAGFGEVRSRPWVWVTIAVFTGAVLCVYAPWYSLAPLLARRGYGGVGFFGVLETCAGAGAVAGALAGLRWRPRRPLRAAFLMIGIWPLQSLLFALLAPEALLVCVALVLGFGMSLFGIWWETALASHIPPRALSRVSAYDWMGSLALLPLGYLVAGPLADAFGLAQVLGAGAVIGFLLLAAGLLPRSTRTLARAPDAAPAQPAGGPVAADHHAVGRSAQRAPSSSRTTSA
jgi:MFS family permease